MIYNQNDERNRNISLKIVPKSVKNTRLSARFSGYQAKFSVVVSYAPKNVAVIEYKEEFYQPLQSVVNSIPKHHITYILRDLNVVVGNDESYCPQALGRHSMVVRNKNGSKMIDFPIANDLVIGGSLFPHRGYHHVNKHT
ncbi:hypothetical protein QYM36_019536 [Artemia franciscana]|uniref:Uncharacterized protein n=1 Tax=Artemia franciscana TaxID=6661 RepID=A0AA88H256_ARTSF|nr:hypothetical protein QYM36_019536 [Artemia franciscana]